MIGITSVRQRALCLAAVLAGVLLFSAACSKYSLNEPNMGATKKFRKDAVWVDPTQYDWSRIKNGSGLYVFTYDVYGQIGNSLSGTSTAGKSGIRIWEKEFKAEQPDTFFKEIAYQFTKKTTALPGSTESGGLVVGIPSLYVRGHVVYGGHLCAGAPGFRPKTPPNGPDTLYEQFLSRYAKNLEGVVIDTAH